MKLTKKFLLDNRTKSNAWTKEQFRIIGMTWPPKASWMSLVKDKELTDAEQAEFILAKDKAAKSLNALEKCYYLSSIHSSQNKPLTVVPPESMQL